MRLFFGVTTSTLQVERACVMCAAKGWTPPTVYQGLYNPLNRLAEKDLLPTLKRNGQSITHVMCMHAYDTHFKILHARRLFFSFVFRYDSEVI